MEKYHYVYRITNIRENKHYYGVRGSVLEPKLDLGVKYFSSSTDKSFINEQKENKSIFKYKIIKQFNSREEAVDLEIKLHTKFDVGVNKSFYNKSKQTSKGWDVSGKKFTNPKKGFKMMNNGIDFRFIHPLEIQYYKDLGYKLGGRALSEEHRLLLCERVVTDNTKRKMSENHADMNGSSNTNAKMIKVYDSDGILVFTSHGSFYKDCLLLNLPTYALVRSYKNNGDRIGITNYSLGNLKKNNHQKYIGWYAIIEV